MLSLHLSCKPPFAYLAKCLKSGADWGLRSPDPLITKHVASLKTNDEFVNRAPKRPQKSATFRVTVNRQGLSTRLTTNTTEGRS